MEKSGDRFIIQRPPISLEWLTLPNFLSLLRIPLALVLFFLVGRGNCREAVALVMTAAFLSDWLDGFIARRTRPTRLGTIIDPLCDKFFFFVCCAAYYAELNGFILWILIFAETSIALSVFGAIYGMKTGWLKKKVNFCSNIFGKIKFGFECAALGFLVLGDYNFANILLFYAIPLAFLSGAIKYSDYKNKPG